MKKIIPLIIVLFILTGCKKTNSIIGEWETKYDISVFGEVTDKYIFKENNECEKIVNAGTEIKLDCTYEFNDDKTKIKISWDGKLYDEYVSYEMTDKDTIKIGEYTYVKK